MSLWNLTTSWIAPFPLISETEISRCVWVREVSEKFSHTFSSSDLRTFTNETTGLYTPDPYYAETHFRDSCFLFKVHLGILNKVYYKQGTPPSETPYPPASEMIRQRGTWIQIKSIDSTVSRWKDNHLQMNDSVKFVALAYRLVLKISHKTDIVPQKKIRTILDLPQSKWVSCFSVLFIK